MWKAEFTERLTQAAPAERKGIVDEYSAMSGHTPTHLYRIAKKHGFSTGRKRSDKGKLKSGLTDEQVKFIFSILHVTGRENKGPIMPVERALQMAVDNRIIKEGQITPASLNRILRDRQLSKRHQKAPKPHMTMRSLHPNHTHVFDVSVCIQYYLKGGKLAVMDERDFYKNKPENFAKIKLRLLRYVVTDHFSGALYFKYYNTTGETQANLYDFLKEAWAHKSNDKLPFRGVPNNLLMDNGSANKSKAIVAMLERMDVNIPKGRPYNPQRQGAVETTHTIIEQWFETGLRIQPATSVEELNEWAIDFLAAFSATKKHTRHGMPRTQCWMSIKPEQIRELPPVEILQDLYANPEEERTVDGTYCISYRGNEYSLKHINGLFRGAKVKAVLKPFKWPVIDIAYRGEVFESTPIESLPAELGGFRVNAAIIGENYKAQPETETQKALKQSLNMAYGEEKKKSAVPFEGLTVFGNHSERIEPLSFIEKPGTPMEVGRSVADQQISFTAFLKRIIGRTGPIPKELNKSLRDRFGSTVPVKVVEEVIKEITEGEDKKKQTAM